MENRYDIQFLERWIDKNHVHFLIHSVPSNSPKKIVSAVKSITTKEIFRLIPKAKLFLLGGKFWPSGYYVNSLGQSANEEVIKKVSSKSRKIRLRKITLGRTPIVWYSDGAASGSLFKSIKFISIFSEARYYQLQ